MVNLFLTLRKIYYFHFENVVENAKMKLTKISSSIILILVFLSVTSNFFVLLADYFIFHQQSNFPELKIITDSYSMEAKHFHQLSTNTRDQNSGSKFIKKITFNLNHFTKIKISNTFRNNPLHPITNQIRKIEQKTDSDSEIMISSFNESEINQFEGFSTNPQLIISYEDCRQILLKPALNEEQRNNLIETLKIVIKISDENQIPYIIVGSTLLGSYRHHGYINWDDDADLLYSIKDYSRLNTFLYKLTDFSLYKVTPYYHWKIFRNIAFKIPQKKFKYPFVDIFFYREFGSRLTAKKALMVNIAKSDIFPLTKRPYLDMMLNAPRNSPFILEKIYKNFEELCILSDYDHLNCYWRPGCAINCSDLAEKIPFVSRTHPFLSSSEISVLNFSFVQKEILVVGSTKISEVEITIPPK